MSSAVFPQLPGLSIETSRRPSFKTKVQESVSGQETRAAFMAYPKWTLRFDFDVLRDGVSFDELRTVEAFFLQHRGMWDSFLVSVPEDCVAIKQQFGIGDGLTPSFQLVRARAGGSFAFVEPTMNIERVDSIKVGGTLVLPSGYSIGSTGRVTFTAAPANGAVLTWSGRFYYRSQADFYQLQAYGQSYLDGVGDVVLIYPKTDNFSDPLPVFAFPKTEGLRLWVVPFCLKTRQLLLPPDAPFAMAFQPRNPATGFSSSVGFAVQAIPAETVQAAS